MHTCLNVYRHFAIRAVVAATALAAIPAAQGQLGLGLSPMRLDVRISPAAQHSGVLSLSNSSPDKVRVRAELLDFFIDATGTPQFERTVEGEKEYSCRTWLTLNPSEFEMKPGERMRIRYTVRVPETATARSYHCGAGFTTVPVVTQSAETGLQTAVRVVAAFYAIIGNPGIEASFKDMILEYTPEIQDSRWRAVVLLENYGYMHFRPVGSLDVLDAAGKVVESAVFRPLPVLPKRTQRFLFPLKLSQGKYTLRARVDLGTREIQEVITSVEARPDRK